MEREPHPKGQPSGISGIRAALGGARPSKRLGQTFMIDPNLLSAVVRDARVGKDDFVLEIGTGTGRLTEALARAAGFVLSVEIDERLARIARDRLSRLSNVEILNADILGRSRAVSETVEERVLSLSDGRPPLVVGNLPYSISGRIVAALVLWHHGPAREKRPTEGSPSSSNRPRT
jgi:16S rRNA (adenine1518-N6/adenine1519-N6)-dimethyltransferase